MTASSRAIAACCSCVLSRWRRPRLGQGAGLKQHGVEPVLLDVEHHVCLAERLVGFAQLQLGLAEQHAQLELARGCARGPRCRPGPALAGLS